MIIDTSAVYALLAQEPDAGRLAGRLDGAEVCRMSAATHVELTILCRGRDLLPELDALLALYEVKLEAFDEEQARIARQAQLRYGSGRHRLNLGDTFAYALAKRTGEPLLFKGRDFARTDVVSALDNSAS